MGFLTDEEKLEIELDKTIKEYSITITKEDINFIKGLMKDLMYKDNNYFIGKITLLLNYFANVKKLEEIGVKYDDDHPERKIKVLKKYYEKVKPILSEPKPIPIIGRNLKFYFIKTLFSIYFDIEDNVINPILYDIDDYVYKTKTDRSRTPKFNEKHSFILIKKLIDNFNLFSINKDRPTNTKEEHERLRIFIKKEIKAIQNSKKATMIVKHLNLLYNIDILCEMNNTYLRLDEAIEQLDFIVEKIEKNK